MSTSVWFPSVVTPTFLTRELLAVKGGQKASAGGVYDDLFLRDGARVAKAIAKHHPGAAIAVLLALAQFQGEQADASTNEFPGALPHQVHREFVGGMMSSPTLIEHSARYASTWGVAMRGSSHCGHHFAIYNDSDGQCLFVIVLRRLMQLHPRLNVLGREYRHWATNTTRSLAVAATEVLRFLVRMIHDSNLGLYEIPNTNPRQTSPSGALFDGFDAYFHPAKDGIRPVNWRLVAYIHNQQLAYEALLCGAELFPDDRNVQLWLDTADQLRRNAVRLFGLDSGTGFPPAAYDRDEFGRARPVHLESLASLELLEGRFLSGLLTQTEIVRMLVKWLYSEAVMTAVGPRCQPLKYAPLEGEYCPYQGTPSVWAIMDWIVAEGLHNQGLDPLFHDLALLRMTAGLDRSGTAIESWPVHRETGAVCYRPHETTTRGDADLVMACSEVGQLRQAWSISSGLAALEAQAIGYRDVPGNSWQEQLCKEALSAVSHIFPAADNRPEILIHIDLERGRELKAKRVAQMGLAAH
ncbi:MAG TPA: hypothetical protein VF272_00500 [Candidatus Saccharimonadia bacterium]